MSSSIPIMYCDGIKPCHLPSGAAPLQGSTIPGSHPVLCSKILTHSDISTDVTRGGRLCLPTKQIEQCLQRLLYLGTGLRHYHQPEQLANLDVDLTIYDVDGEQFTMSLRTWQHSSRRVAGGQGSLTYLIKNTAPFMQKHNAKKDSLLQLYDGGDRLIMDIQDLIDRPHGVTAGMTSVRPQISSQDTSIEGGGAGPSRPSIVAGLASSIGHVAEGGEGAAMDARLVRPTFTRGGLFIIDGKPFTRNTAVTTFLKTDKNQE